MKKIFIVTRGEYSDYSIIAVFSSRELALEFIENSQEYMIEEFILDETEVIKAGYKKYLVKMDYWGNTEKVEEKPLDSRIEIYIGNDNSFNATVFSKSIKHAIKIANEKRVQLIANNIFKPLEK